MEKFPGWDRIDGSSVPKEEIDAAWMAVQRTIKDSESRNNRRPGKNHVRTGWVAIAAAIAVALISPLAAWLWASRQEAPVPRMCQATTSRGEVTEVILPDGTKAVLNAESVLVYPEKFGSDRSVFLSGEASFDVTSDEQHPFYVHTSDITVKVHGTRFNVNAYFDEPTVKATLYRGVITAWPEESEERAVTLKPNQYFAYEKETGAVTTAPANALESVAWESGALCFRSASISSVIKTLERRFGVSIALTTGKYDTTVITASFIHGETLDDLMDAICMIVPGMKYTREENKIYIK
ncbi:MAG: DUF4974 domain-containing protein [Bacteroidales bacterium]|nr:DUF4974 domain-containing protein [Bacteroidales bacterium]